IVAQASALRLSLAPGHLPPPNVGAIMDASQEAVALLRRCTDVAQGRPETLADTDLNEIVGDGAELLRQLVFTANAVEAEPAPLILARAIARYHNGEFESLPTAGGQSFVITLPSAEIRPTSTSAPMPAAADEETAMKALSQSAMKGPRPRSGPLETAPSSA